MKQRKYRSNYQLEYFRKAKEEYGNLEGNQLVFVNKGLDMIKVLGMKAGQPLHGPLAGCHKLKNKKMGLRIVFRQKSHHIEIIQIIAIGKRRRAEVYKQAAERIKNNIK